jgi:flagellar assembly factor FliW
VADPHYSLNLTSEELFELDLPAGREPLIGEDILCATLICVAQGEVPTANLMAPVVVNLRKHIGMQVIHGDSGYSHRHPLLREEAAFSCS